MPVPCRYRTAVVQLPPPFRRGHVDATSNAVTNARAVAAGRVAMRKATPSPATRAKKAAVLPDIAGTPLDKGAEIDALAKLPVEKQRSLAEAAKRGEQVSAIKALSACDPEAPKTSDGTAKEADRAPTLDPQAWSVDPAGAPGLRQSGRTQ